MYFTEIIFGNLTVFLIIESILFGTLISIAIYFFTKNEWASIPLGPPLGALYLFHIHKYSYHIIFYIIHLVILIIIIYSIKKIQKAKLSKKV